MNVLTKQFINTLFNEGEYACIGHKFANQASQVASLKYEDKEYVTINPIKKGTTRSGNNVTAFRNFLFEIDKDFDNNTVSQKVQAELIHNSKMPWSTCTFSGSKSLHWILSLEEPLKDRPIYTAYFLAIQSVLKKYGANVDGACKDPARFTRAPFGINTKAELIEKYPDPEQRRQPVKKVKGRVPLEVVDAWLKENGVKVEDFIITPSQRVDTGVTSNASVDRKFEVIANNFMPNMKYEDGNYNYQYKMAWYLLGCGCTEAEITEKFMQEWGHIHENKPIQGAMKSSDPCKSIYISTPEEQKQYYKSIETDLVLERRRSGFDRDLPPEVKAQVKAENLERYLVVGTEYFKIDSESDRLLPWTKTIFEKDYGSNAVPPLRYDKFGYKPDYLSEKFPYNLGADGRTRNSFIRPTYQIVPGEWKTIESGLRHGFGDQYELALQYCAILIAYPEAKLPAILFVGSEETGKSGIFAIFRLLVGPHVFKKVSVKKLESEFTDFLAQSQIVLCEEVGGFKDPKGMMDNLKDWITENGTQSVNPKYGKQFDSPIHTKFIFTSNNYDALELTGDATRFWVRELLTKPKKLEGVNYYEAIEAEIGHFVHYLVKEIVPTIKLGESGQPCTEKSRLYFTPEQIYTPIKDVVKDLSRSDLYENILTVVSDFFAKHKEEQDCYVDLSGLSKSSPLLKATGYKALKLCLTQEFKKTFTNQLERPDSLNFDSTLGTTKPRRASRWIKFTREEIVGDTLFDMSSIKMV